MNKWLKLLVRLVPALAVMAMIYYFSAQTGSELQGMFPFLDSFDWGHLVAYFVLALALYWGIFVYNIKYTYVIVVVICLLYGLTDEWHQAYVPNRSPDIKDLVNDTIGATVAMMLVYLVRRK